jgi:hypothetical protein
MTLWADAIERKRNKRARTVGVNFTLPDRPIETASGYHEEAEGEQLFGIQTQTLWRCSDTHRVGPLMLSVTRTV